MPVISYIDAINLAMKEEMERDDRVFVLGEDVGLWKALTATTFASVYSEIICENSSTNSISLSNTKAIDSHCKI